MVATTSIRPFTRKAGNPTAQAITPATTADAPSAGTSGHCASTVRADREEAGLCETDVAGEQHAIGGQSEQRMNADDLHKSEVKIHRVVPRLQSRPTGIANTPPGRKMRKANSNSMM